MSEEIKNIPVFLDTDFSKPVGRATLKDGKFVFEFESPKVFEFYSVLARDGLLEALKLGGVINSGNPNFHNLETS